MTHPLDTLCNVLPAPASLRDIFRVGNLAKQSLVLTGPRSVGKTTTAKLVAERLDLPYYDTDSLVNTGLGERFSDALAPMKTGAPLPYLEAAMSKRRFDWIEEILQASCERLAASRSSHILAAAGGAFSYAAVAEALHADAIVVGLVPSMDPSKSVQVLLERERQRSHFRGVSNAELEQICRAHVEQVFELLRAHADDVLLVENDEPQAVTSKIISKHLSRL